MTPLYFCQHSYYTTIIILEVVVYSLHSSFQAEIFLWKEEKLSMYGNLRFFNPH